MTYALRARILAADGSLMFINDTHTPVITRDAGNHAFMVLVSAGRKSPALASRKQRTIGQKALPAWIRKASSAIWRTLPCFAIAAAVKLFRWRCPINLQNFKARILIPEQNREML